MTAYSTKNTNDLGTSRNSGATTDYTIKSGAYTMDAWHRACFSVINGYMQVYIDGVFVGNCGNFTDAYNIAYLTLGNTWRFRVNNGDRAFGGKIRNVALWTDAISLDDMVLFSTPLSDE